MASPGKAPAGSVGALVGHWSVSVSVSVSGLLPLKNNHADIIKIDFILVLEI